MWLASITLYTATSEALLVLQLDHTRLVQIPTANDLQNINFTNLFHDLPLSGPSVLPIAGHVDTWTCHVDTWAVQGSRGRQCGWLIRKLNESHSRPIIESKIRTFSEKEQSGSGRRVKEAKLKTTISLLWLWNRGLNSFRLINCFGSANFILNWSFKFVTTCWYNTTHLVHNNWIL